MIGRRVWYVSFGLAQAPVLAKVWRMFSLVALTLFVDAPVVGGLFFFNAGGGSPTVLSCVCDSAWHPCVQNGSNLIIRTVSLDT